VTRRIKRHAKFEITLDIKDDEFINPPRAGQRQWLLNQALAEMTDDLIALDSIAASFVPGEEEHRFEDRSSRSLRDEDIMEDWQIPMMQAMAEIATIGHGDVLEIGFGRGVSAEMIQSLGVKSHTVIECNDSVVERFHQWQKSHPEQDIRLVHGRWQDVIGELSLYDGIFFHTYPLNEEEYMDQALSSATFAEHFFSTASQLLRNGGVFTYLSNEIDSLSRRHQRALYRHFSRIATSIVEIPVPKNVKDTWWSDHMVAVEATK
jgi:guanidinoacetate N-methyltransferase